MTSPFEKLEECAKQFQYRLAKTSTQESGINDARFPWKDYVYVSSKYRRAHINIVDAREDHKLLMMHCTIFPHTNDPSPIFGFDVIAGPSRISGAFHDFSAAGDANHFMLNWFDKRVTDLNWKKERKLPDWAQAIFSPAMIAAGAITEEAEMDQLINVALENLDYYLENVGKSYDPYDETTCLQNRYCYYQKKNPHNGATMQKLGLSEQEATEFVETIMFPEIE